MTSDAASETLSDAASQKRLNPQSFLDIWLNLKSLALHPIFPLMSWIRTASHPLPSKTNGSEGQRTSRMHRSVCLIPSLQSSGTMENTVSQLGLISRRLFLTTMCITGSILENVCFLLPTFGFVRDGHELFFQDICLQYINSSSDEDLITEPQSDTTSAFTVIRTSNTSVSGNAGVSLSHIPSAHISLGISRSRECTIQRTVGTWSVSAHRIIPEYGKRRRKVDIPRYQWFWAANYREISSLTPDLAHTVKRHVVSAREVLRRRTWKEQAEGPNALGEEAVRYALYRKKEEAWEAVLADWRKAGRRIPLEHLLEFRFCLLIRLRRRYGRLNHTLLLSSNRNKAKLLEPIYKEKFCIRLAFTQDIIPAPSQLSLENVRRPRNVPNERHLQNIVCIPLANTYDLREVLARIKTKYEGKWDELQSKDWVDLVQKETGTEVREADAMEGAMVGAGAGAYAGEGT
ncbi:hypothetical protein BBP40_002318 [Aspergillus hancockii]|nr:hypothetical protein BBP40_002318 [Aspergillus hancockii]